MKNKRRIHSAGFKVRVALDAIKGIKTAQEIAADNQVRPTQVTQWKSQMLAGASEVCDQGRGRKIQGKRLNRIRRGLREKSANLSWSLTGSQKVQGAGNRSMRKAMLEKNHPQLGVRRQSELLAVNRNRLKPERAIEPPELSENTALRDVAGCR